jgi:hypothetical protein
MSRQIFYDILVTTSNIPLAGTDANVFITIYGPKLDTGLILCHRKNENKMFNFCL